jgi:shikimate kinase
MQHRGPRIPRPEAPNLYLVGFMGTGKSAVGQRVSQVLGMPFIDSDKWIEEDQGMSVASIFERKGEPFFRALERRFVFEDQPGCHSVISCGGGLVTQPELLQRIRLCGVVVVLYAGIETLLKRLSGDTNRPLMQVEDPRARIEALLAQRESAYKEAGVGIMTDGYSVQEVADHVIRIYLDKCR